jgi:aspartate racemase
MIRLGLIGGLGHESTIDYYRRINDLWKQRRPESLPELTIDSLDVNRGIKLVSSDLDGLIAYLYASVNRLSGAGCEIAAMAANTPHIVFDQLAARSPIPLISIVETCAAEAERRRLRRVGLLGTGFTMGATFYPDVFKRRDIAVCIPDAAGRSWLHERYLGELLVGTFTEDTRDGVRRLVDALIQKDQIDAVVLAGTELPLLLESEGINGLPVLDTTEIHVQAIVDAISA